MTAPVPPDANGPREAVEALAAKAWRPNRGYLYDSTTEAYAAGRNGVIDDLRALLAASEAAPTAIPHDDRLVTCPECRSTFEAEDGSVVRTNSEATPTTGEREAACPWCHYGDPHPTFSEHLPATPPADDASEGLSGGDRELIWRAVAETPCGPLHAEFGWTPGEACSKCEDRADELMPFLTRQVEGIVAARATWARAEGAAEAGERIARAIEDLPGPEGDEQETYMLAVGEAARIARSDAAPHTGEQS